LIHHRDNPNFSLVSEVLDSSPPRWDKFYIAIILFLAMVITEVAAGLGLVLLALVVTGIYLVLGVTTAERAFNAIQWDVIVTVASAFGLSYALEKTQVAAITGNAFALVAIRSGTGFVGLIFAMLLVTMIFSSLINNNAAALLMFPIAASAGLGLGIGASDPRFLLIQFALMFGASDYATPIGYQTNQMVMKPGGYVHLDYIKYGIPLMFVLLIAETIVLAVPTYWYLCWIASIGLYIVTIFWDLKFRAKQGFFEGYFPSKKQIQAQREKKREAKVADEAAPDEVAVIGKLDG
jgi:di/tricarboxylate transporter